MATILQDIAKALGKASPTDEQEQKSLARIAAKAPTDLLDKMQPKTQAYLLTVQAAIKSKKAIPMAGLSAEANEDTAVHRVVPVAVVEETQDDDGSEKSEPIPEDIKCETHTKTYTVELLLKMHDEGRLKLPVFQRKFVWTKEQRQAFIASVLLGLPTPNVMFAVDGDSEERSILDGFQRISTLDMFLKGKEKTGAQLKGYKNKFFSDLPKELQNRFLHREIVVMEVKASRLTDLNYIFRMINKGGQKLTAMEIRRATFRHPVFDMLEEITEGHEFWIQLFGIDKHYKGLQALLRSIAMHDRYKTYTKGIDQFIDGFCYDVAEAGIWDTDKQTDAHALRELKQDIELALEVLSCHVGEDAFRLGGKGKVVNLGLVDCMFHACFIALRELGETGSVDQIGAIVKSVRSKLLSDDQVMETLTRDTSGKANVIARMDLTETYTQKAMKKQLTKV